MIVSSNNDADVAVNESMEVFAKIGGWCLLNSSTQGKIKKLQPSQNRAVRTIEKLTGYVSTQRMNELHAKLNLEILNDSRNFFHA